MTIRAIVPAAQSNLAPDGAALTAEDVGDIEAAVEGIGTLGPPDDGGVGAESYWTDDHLEGAKPRPVDIIPRPK